MPQIPTTSDTAERLASLRDAVSVEEDSQRKAILRWELGRLAERAGDDATAVKAFLAAYNEAPGFRPPLFDLIRVFERRRSFKNLARLYDAEYRSGKNPTDRTSALADLAALLEDRGGGSTQPVERLVEALECPPGPALGTAGLFLERSARRAGDSALLIGALEARISAAKDPTWRALLIADLAEVQAAGGTKEDLKAAAAKLFAALELGGARFRILEALERLGRRYDRPAELAAALEGLGELAAAAAQGDSEEAGSGAFSVQRFADSKRAAGKAAAYYFEAASIRMQRLGDPRGALECLQRAVALRPDDPLLPLVLVEAAHQAGDGDVVDEQTKRMLESGSGGRDAAALLYYAAHAAAARGQEQAALNALAATMKRAPESIVARATADAWMMASGRFDAWIDALATRDDDGGLSLWRAATLAAHQLADFPRAKRLYQQAIERHEDPALILRELYTAASELEDSSVDEALDAIMGLLPHVEGEERAALLHHRYTLLRDAGRSDEAANVLMQALKLEETASWSADAARAYAAGVGNHALLAEAHRVIAEQADDDEVVAAHLAAGARALCRADNLDAAVEMLERSLERSPGQLYGVALLEELYRARGDADAVVQLLRRAAAARSGARAGMVAILMAGAAAEASGDPKLAAETYEEAAQQDPDNISPLWALARLAERTQDEALLLRAREALSEREISTGSPGRATLELAEHYDKGGDTERAEAALQACLQSPVAAEAATALLTLRQDQIDPLTHLQALEALLPLAAEEDVPRVQRELGQTAAADELAPELAEETAAAVLERDEHDRWALLTRLFAAARDASDERPELWLRLGTATSDPEATSALTLHGLRSQIVGAEPDSDAAEDAFLIAQELVADAEGSAAAATAVDETLSTGDDADAFADALLGRLRHTSDATRGSIESAAARALAAAVRPEATGLLRKVVTDDPTDLSAWESLRIAARAKEEWETVVEACDVLAEHIDGELQHELLEEGAAILMDTLGRPADAEKRLRIVAEADRSRPNAYFRLHDLIAEREDPEALLELVEKRIDAIDDSDQLERLYYEKARLHRARGELDDALEAIENLVMLDEEHVGGIALAVEIYVSREQWREAVDSLRQIARADVPAKQKRISRMGAADFLQKKLDDPLGALTELEEVEKLGMADAKIFERMARIAEEAQLFPKAVQALLSAAEHASGPRRAALARRAARIQHEELGEREGAILTYSDALDHAPTDLEAGEAIFALLPNDQQRLTHSLRFEGAVRETMNRDGITEAHLRALARAAVWRNDATAENQMLQALVALGVADEDELRAASDPTSIMQRAPGGLDDAKLGTLVADGDQGPIHSLLSTVYEPLCSAAGLEPSHLGARRNELVGTKQASAERDELNIYANLFGLQLGDVYWGGSDDERIQAMWAKKERTTWVIGGSVRSPFDAFRRFLVGQQAMAARRRTIPIVRRDPDDGATLILAIGAACDVPIASGSDRPGLVDWTHRLTKAMPRKIKRAVAGMGLALDPHAIELYCTAARRTSMRAGLLVSGDLSVVLHALLGGTVSFEMLGYSPDAMDLLHFWISPEMTQLRRGLGA